MLNIRTIQFLCLLSFIILRCTAWSQSSYYHFNEYTLNSGLKTVYSTFFLKDSRGFTWISSTEGLNCFDGQRAKIYQHSVKDSSSLADNNIQSSFFEDKNGDIWFSTATAIHRYIRAKDKFERIRVEFKNQIITNDYYVFDLDRNGYLWFRIGDWAAQPSLYKLNIYSSAPYIYERVSDFNGYRSIKFNTDTFSYTYAYPSSTAFGVCEYKSSNKKNPILVNQYFTGLSNDPFKEKFKIRSVIPQDSIYLWLASESGLILLNRKYLTYKLFNIFQNKPISALRSAVVWKKDKIIVASENNGLVFFDKKQQKFYHQIKRNSENSLCSDNFEALHIDNDENLWLFSWKNSCINHINLKKLRFPPIDTRYLQNDYIAYLQEDGQQNIWVATKYGYLLAYNKEHQLIKIYDNKFFPEKNLKNVLKDSLGNLWFLNHSRLVLYRHKTQKFETIFNSVDNSIKSAKVLDKKYLLFLTKNKIYEISYRGDGSIQLGHFDKLPMDYISIKAKDIFFITKYSKACILNDDLNLYIFDYSGTKWILDTILPIADIISQALEYEQGLWLAGEKGLWCLNNIASKQYNLKLEQLIPFLRSIQEDNQRKNLWLSSENALYQYNITNKKLKQFTSSDGINNILVHSLEKTSTGEMWLANYNRVNVFKPEEIKDYDVRPQMQVTGIKVNDEPYTEGGNVTELSELVLDYKHNTVELEFVAIEYGDSKGTKIKYRLDNYDTDSIWTERDNIKPVIKYFKLPPGAYTFYLKGYNSDGIESETRTLIIRITPPWYKTWWGMSLWIGAIIALVGAMFLWRLRLLKRRAEFQQKILQTEMKALRAQMDPHFLYNTMNSINAFILQNDRMKASRFLSDFAHLIRKILDFSKEETISIEQEVEILRGFMEMESMRFNNSFDYEFVIDDELDTWDTQIPTMIIQPFIENAIIHGIRNKKNGRGKITIRFEADGNQHFICSIEDNGVGRTRAAEINNQTRSKSHNSKGWQITQDRIDILNHQYPLQTSLHIEDLKNEQREPSGTKITIRMPIYLGIEL